MYEEDNGSMHRSNSELFLTACQVKRADIDELSGISNSPKAESQANTENSSSTSFSNLRICGSSTAKELSADLKCGICNQLFYRPVMVTCGHSFCEACIERQTRTDSNCVLCGKDVGPLSAMIPSIALMNIVQKIKAADVITSYDDLFICDESKKPKPVRRASMQNSFKRQCFFSIAAPTVCASPLGVQRRKPLPANTQPTRSVLKQKKEDADETLPYDGKFDTDEEEDIFDDVDFNAAVQSRFRRDGFARRSERYTSSTTSRMKKDEVLKKIEKDNVVKRNSLLRRSFNAIKQKTRKQKVQDSEGGFVNAACEELDDEVPAMFPGTSDNPNSKEKPRSLWKRLFTTNKMGKEVTPTATIVSEQVAEENKVENAVEHQNLGYYTGIGKKFERIEHGEEITVVVYGHSHSGKTAFVRSLKAALEGSQIPSASLVPLCRRYAMTSVRVPPYAENDNRLPQVVTIKLDLNDTTLFVDVVDPEYDDSCLPMSYMSASDGAILLLDASNCASLLSMRQMHRNLLPLRQNDGESVEISLVTTKSEVVPRVLSRDACEREARTIKAPLYDIDTSNFDVNIVIQMLQNMCCSIIDNRIPVNHSQFV